MGKSRNSIIIFGIIAAFILGSVSSVTLAEGSPASDAALIAALNGIRDAISGITPTQTVTVQSIVGPEGPQGPEGPAGSGGGTATDLNCSGCVSEAELDFDSTTQSELTSALAALGQHYTNAEAVAAMGATDNANPLNHDRYTDAEVAIGLEPFTACPAGLVQGGSWCIETITHDPATWANAAIDCQSLGLELVPSGILAQAVFGGFVTTPPGETTWSSTIGNDPAISGTDAVRVNMGPTAQMFNTGITNAIEYLCGKPLLV